MFDELADTVDERYHDAKENPVTDNELSLDNLPENIYLGPMLDKIADMQAAPSPILV